MPTHTHARKALKSINGDTESFCLASQSKQENNTDNFRADMKKRYVFFVGIRIARYICASVVCVCVLLFQHIVYRAFDDFMFITIDFIASLRYFFYVSLGMTHENTTPFMTNVVAIRLNWRREEAALLISMWMHGCKAIRFFDKIHLTISKIVHWSRAGRWDARIQKTKLVLCERERERLGRNVTRINVEMTPTLLLMLGIQDYKKKPKKRMCDQEKNTNIIYQNELGLNHEHGLRSKAQERCIGVCIGEIGKNTS